MVGFRAAKDGSELWEWDDYFGYDGGDPQGGSARCVVLDGATGAFDAQRWVEQLAGGFLGQREPYLGRLTSEALLPWVERMQQLWLDEAAVGDLNPFEEIKFRDHGSLATFLGCQIDGLSSAEPTWAAAALGDVVLFHVRDGRLLETFPDMGPDDFGIDPVGVFTLPRMLPRMSAELRLRGPRPLRVGDHLYIASDALAEWLVRRHPAVPWDFFADLDDTAVFTDFTGRLRSAGQLVDDDLTLLRVEITAGDPDYFVVAG